MFLGWKLEETESKTLSREKALAFATTYAGMPHSPVEREIDKARVKKLCDIIRNGRAIPFNWATVKYNKQIVRMNGQHSSLAILEVGPDIPDHLSFHIDRYSADSREGMVGLFRQFDQRFTVRSIHDISGAYQGLVPELVACNRKVMKVAADGISFCKRDVLDQDAPVGDDTYDLLHKEIHTPFFVWVNGIATGYTKELLRKQVMGAIWITYETSQSGASKFWRGVASGPDYFTDDKDPAAVLTDELTRAQNDKDYREAEFAATSLYYKKAIKAWNAFCAGQKIASLKVTKGNKGKPGWPEVSSYGGSDEVAA